jgi:hypothetical protein
MIGFGVGTWIVVVLVVLAGVLAVAQGIGLLAGLLLIFRTKVAQGRSDSKSLGSKKEPPPN